MSIDKKTSEPEISPRLAAIQSFVTDPPENDYQRGYLACLMDEAVEDIEEAGSDIFEEALNKLFDQNAPIIRNLKIRRAKTLA